LSANIPPLLCPSYGRLYVEVPPEARDGEECTAVEAEECYEEEVVG